MQRSRVCVKLAKCLTYRLMSFSSDQAVNWVDRLKYLGLHFCCQKQLSIDISVTVRKVYAAANAILRHSRFVSDIIRLSLMESYVLPMNE